MWIKIEETLYNTDDFRLIKQSILGYEPTRYTTAAICKDGRHITLANEPLLDKIVALLNPKEVN